MLASGGDTHGLFHAAFMQSGAPIPVGDIVHGQAEFDNLVVDTGCDSAVDKLECLRLVPYPALKAAVDKSPGVISYQVRCRRSAWTSRPFTVFTVMLSPCDCHTFHE